MKNKLKNISLVLMLLCFSIIFISSCKNEEEDVKPVIPEPVANFIYSPATPIVGTVIEFTNQSTNASSYKWSSDPASLNSTEVSPSHTFTTIGTYQITLTATSEEGKTATSTKSITIQEIPKPIASFDVSSNVKIGNEVIFSNSTTNTDTGVTYQWSSVPVGFSSTEQNPTFIFTQRATDYAITLKVTNANGESNQISKTITVSNNPENINGLASQSLARKINEGFDRGWFTTTRGDSLILEHSQGNYRMYNNTAGGWSAWQINMLNGVDNTKNFELKVTLSKLIALSNEAPSISFRFGTISTNNDQLTPNQDQLYYQNLFTYTVEEPNKSLVRLIKITGEVGSLSGEALNEKTLDSSLSIQEEMIITFRHYEGKLYMFIDDELYGSSDYVPYKGQGVYISLYQYTEVIWNQLDVFEIR